jgi:hypothetical protein
MSRLGRITSRRFYLPCRIVLTGSLSLRLNPGHGVLAGDDANHSTVMVPNGTAPSGMTFPP